MTHREIKIENHSFYQRCGSGSRSVGAVSFLIFALPDPDPSLVLRIWIRHYLFGSGSGSVPRSGSFHYQAQQVWYCDFFSTLIFEDWCKWTFKKCRYPNKQKRKKTYFFGGIWKATDETSKIRSWIHKSEVRYGTDRVSGSVPNNTDPQHWFVHIVDFFANSRSCFRFDVIVQIVSLFSKYLVRGCSVNFFYLGYPDHVTHTLNYGVFQQVADRK